MLMKKIDKVTIDIVFTENHFKQSSIDAWLPDEFFTRSSDWETCPIDGCMNCVYKSNDNVNPNDILYLLINFVNGCFSGNKDSDEERIRVTRKLLAHTRLTTFEIKDCCQIMFKVKWINA